MGFATTLSTWLDVFSYINDELGLFVRAGQVELGIGGLEVM